MIRRRRVVLIVGAAAATLSISPLISCLKDPRADQSVTVINTCDTASLSTDPTSPQSSLLAYVNAAGQLQQQASAVEAQILDACNAMDTELGLATGTSAITACGPIASRMAALDSMQPGGLPPAGDPYFAELRYAQVCVAQPGAYQQCVASCAGPCDATKCGNPADLAGTCQGQCNGECIESGTGVACNGSCVGEAPIMGPPTGCQGECIGACTGIVWTANCAGACVGGEPQLGGVFLGSCAGTCTGACNGMPINVPMMPDGGTMPEGGTEAGVAEGGMPEAGTPEAGTPEAGMGEGGMPMMGGAPPVFPPPANADGNCKGLCAGICSSGASGFCANSPCLTFAADGGSSLGQFSEGNCYSGECIGVCVSATGTGTHPNPLPAGPPMACNGQCTSKNPQCTGVCVGDCAGTRTNSVCQGKLSCGQNTECENACEAAGVLTTTCSVPKAVESYAVMDPALGMAFQNHGPQLGQAIGELAVLRQAYAYIGDRSYGDFVTIGLTGDLVRACVSQGETALAAANTSITAALAADPSVYRFTP